MNEEPSISNSSERLIPDTLRKVLVGESISVGKLFSVDDYVEYLYKNAEQMADTPIVDRRLNIVISKPTGHSRPLLILGRYHEVSRDGKRLLNEVNWITEYGAVRNRGEAEERRCRSEFILGGGYYITHAMSAFHFSCVCSHKKRFDVTDETILKLLHCSHFDYPYG